MNNQTKICLSIAGLDPSGGAGSIADIKTFFAFRCYPTAAIASITYQNTTGVFGTSDQNADIIRQQVQPIIDDYQVSAVKTGMLPNREIIEEVARLISDNGLINLVVDPVVRSTSGFDLIDDAALQALTEKLFPLADIITPNIPEAERISGLTIKNEEDMLLAGGIIQSMGAKNVLIKGGHIDLRSEGERKATDVLFMDEEIHYFHGPFHNTDATHGTGCTLAAAIAANLALDNPLIESIRISKDFVNEAIRTAPGIGKGHSPINIRPV